MEASQRRCTGHAADIRRCGPRLWELYVLDFKDAFKQIRVQAAERKHLAGKALDGYFFYLCVLFGIKSGPLVWGRTAALLMRLTAAAVHNEPVRGMFC